MCDALLDGGRWEVFGRANYKKTDAPETCDALLGVVRGPRVLSVNLGVMYNQGRANYR
jgi:hypothetical protein